MLPHLGMEGAMGRGGGLVSAESTKHLQLAEDYLARGDGPRAVSHLAKARLDRNNLDADLMAVNFAPTKVQGLKAMEAAEKKGRGILKREVGPTCFEEGDMNCGRFWGLLETRPYMRIMQTMVRWAYDTEEYGKAVHYASEMLRLCRSDNLGIREWLPSLLHARRPADALNFVQQWSTPAAQEGEPLPGGGTQFAVPSKGPMSDEEVERQIKAWAEPQMMYSGALAAFKL
ncbi:hypothetical protein FRB94_014475 [Tulasnella sp. JGI-2019a]|nr:hypothetical protein FRB94_014475 [Tulasnella sp. JGI-2019a]